MALGSITTTIVGLSSVTSTTFVGALTGHASSDVALAGSTMTGLLILSGDPSAALGAATKQYVDAISAGISAHASCETATTAASNLSANTYTNGVAGGSPDTGLGVGATIKATANVVLGTVGGYAGLQVGSRLLVKDQADTTQNGVYVVTSLGSTSGPTTPWILTRAADYNNSIYGEVHAGDTSYIQEGTLTGTQWVQTSVGTQSPGDVTKIGLTFDPIVFSQFASPGIYTAGTGISVTSGVIANTGVLSLTTSSGLSTNTSATGNVSITNTGVTSIVAGTNISVSGATGAVTVNVSGTVANATNAVNATNATYIVGGATNSVPYQTGSGVTAFLAQGTGVLQETAGAPVWTTTPTLTGTNFSGIGNGALTNSSLTVGSTNIALGATSLTLSGLTSVAATTFNGALSGNATSATTATNLAVGASGSLPYQSSAGITAMLAAGSTAQVLISGTTPAWTNISGLSVSSAATATNIAGGSGGQVHYQSGVGTTAFVSNAAGVLQAATSGATPAWTTAPTLTGTNFTGIPNGGLTNSALVLGSTSMSLGSTTTTVAGLSSVTSTTFVGALTGSCSGTAASETLATVTSRGSVATNNILLPAVAANGYCFWGDSVNYKIAMASASDYFYGPVTDYSIKLIMGGGSGRGITFGQAGVAPVAAINTTSGDMTIAGAFSATTKSFLIPHPTKPNKKLRYGSLEGPENGVYVRGNTTSDVIELPEYWTKLVSQDSITVSLTAIGKGQQLYVADIKNNKIYIANEKKTKINCFYTIFAERIDVAKLVTEQE